MKGELILVVDDDADVGDVAAAILTRFGYRAITCRDGADAIALFAERSAEIAAVITDLNLPRLGGSALAVIIHRLRPDVKILAMTGLNSRQPSDFPGAASFAGTIQKPFSVETFLLAVDRTLHAGGGTAG